MKNYTLGFIQTINGEEAPRQYWRCEADDLEHAAEQLRDEVEHCQGEKLLFFEVIKNS